MGRIRGFNKAVTEADKYTSQVPKSTDSPWFGRSVKAIKDSPLLMAVALVVTTVALAMFSTIVYLLFTESGESKPPDRPPTGQQKKPIEQKRQLPEQKTAIEQKRQLPEQKTAIEQKKQLPEQQEIVAEQNKLAEKNKLAEQKKLVDEIKIQHPKLKGLEDKQLLMIANFKDQLVDMNSEELLIIGRYFRPKLLEGKSSDEIKNLIKSEDSAPVIAGLKNDLVRLAESTYFLKVLTELGEENAKYPEENRFSHDQLKEMAQMTVDTDRQKNSLLQKGAETTLDASRSVFFGSL